jgi:chromosome segregation ATPase
MNQDELKGKKSDRDLSTRKIFVSSQVPPKDFFFYLIVAGIVLATFAWTFFGISSQQDNLVKINNRLITLEENVQTSSDSSEENIETLLADLKIINREIRKLWDLSNKKNKKDISVLSEQNKVISDEIFEVQNNSASNTESLEEMDASLKNIKARLAKLSSFELNSNTFAERLVELEEAIEAVDAYRKQTNQTIADLQDQLSSKPNLIDSQ